MGGGGLRRVIFHHFVFRFFLASKWSETSRNAKKFFHFFLPHPTLLPPDGSPLDYSLHVKYLLDFIKIKALQIERRVLSADDCIVGCFYAGTVQVNIRVNLQV